MTAAVVLVGLMGAGKSTVGALVATETDRRLVDSDAAIEARTGRTVRELWEDGGEAAYRALESAVVIDAVASGERVVVAAPGGAVLDPAVRTALEAAYVVWLRVDPATLASRVQPDDHRPLLGDRPLEVLQEMESTRSDLYEAVSDLVVDAAGRPPEEIARQIVESSRDT